MKHLTSLLVALALAAIATLAGAAPPDVEVIASGLNNPRGLAFSPGGYLYVAEVGSGGGGACRPSPDGMPVQVCYGETGALTRIDPYGLQPPKKILSGLPSMAQPGGFAATSGPVDVDFFGNSAFVLMAWGGDPALREGIGRKSRLFGTVLRVLAPDFALPVTDIAGNEQKFNPAGGTVDSNPNGMLALPGRRIVADAGANVIVESRVLDWHHRGRDRTLAVLPTTAFGVQPVPTTVVQGPDGYLYVGLLTGAPFFRGSANIYRIPPDGGTPEVFMSGLTAIIDIAFAHDGTLYVVEIASGLVFPAGVAVGPDGALYLSRFGVFPGGGEILRVSPNCSRVGMVCAIGGIPACEPAPNFVPTDRGFPVLGPSDQAIAALCTRCGISGFSTLAMNFGAECEGYGCPFGVAALSACRSRSSTARSLSRPASSLVRISAASPRTRTESPPSSIAGASGSRSS